MHRSTILRRAVLIGLAAAIICTTTRLLLDGSAWDLRWALHGTRLLVAGENPYTDPAPPMGLPLFYPLPTLLMLIPLAGIGDASASILFSGLSAGVLAWAVLTRRAHAWPMFVSAPFVVAVIWSQWAPLLTAAALLPWLFPVALIKPNLGLPILAVQRPRRRVLVVCAVLLLASFVILPSWPLDWLHNARSHDSVAPLLTLPGALLPLALLRWRDSRAQLLLSAAVMPVRFYDPLLLWLIPRSVRGGLVLSGLSWVAIGPWLVTAALTPLARPEMWVVVGLLHLPALVMVLWQPSMARRFVPNSIERQGRPLSRHARQNDLDWLL